MEKKISVRIPGPTPVVRSIQDQMSREIQAFGDPRFVSDYAALIADLGKLLNCSGMTFPLAGTGTLAMEMAVANSAKRGDSVLVVSHGYFGDRFIDICRRKGLDTDVLSAPWGSCVPAADIWEQLKKKAYAAVTVTHVDTSTGAAAPIAEIGAMLREFPEVIFIVDGVAAEAAEYTNCDEMGIDVLFTGSQKAFGVCPGMFVLWASGKSLARRKALGSIPEYYVDYENWIPIMENPAKYFATPAVNLVWAMRESVRIIKEEGFEARCRRHSRNAAALVKALETLGLTPLAGEGCRANSLSCLLYPEGVDDAAFRKALYEEGVIVAGGLGAYAGKMFRLGHMGNIDVSEEVELLGAIERVLAKCGRQVEYGRSVGVYLAERMK